VAGGLQAVKFTVTGVQGRLAALEQRNLASDRQGPIDLADFLVDWWREAFTLIRAEAQADVFLAKLEDALGKQG
jgi:hypothetical protein